MEPETAGRGGHDATVLTIARVLYPPSEAMVQEPRLEAVEHRAWVAEPHDRLFGALVDLLRGVWRVRRVRVARSRRCCWPPRCATSDPPAPAGRAAARVS